MRFIILCTVLPILVLSAAAHTESPPATQFHLFAEEDREHPCWCPVAAGSIARFDLWIWCLPDSAGVCGAEFLVCYPPNTLPSAAAMNTSLIAGQTGDLGSGLSVECSSCQSGWFWIAHQEIWVTSPEKGMICIDPHPMTGIVGARSCAAGNPLEEAYLYGPGLLVNEPGAATEFCYCCSCAPANEIVIAVESQSWGSIKSLFNK